MARDRESQPFEAEDTFAVRFLFRPRLEIFAGLGFAKEHSRTTTMNVTSPS
jgi:hypothetical protein